MKYGDIAIALQLYKGRLIPLDELYVILVQLECPVEHINITASQGWEGAVWIDPPKNIAQIERMEAISWPNRRVTLH